MFQRSGLDQFERPERCTVETLAALLIDLGELRRFFIGTDREKRAMLVRPGPGPGPGPGGWRVTCGPLQAPLPRSQAPDELDVEVAKRLIDRSIDPIAPGRLAGTVVYPQTGAERPNVR